MKLALVEVGRVPFDVGALVRRVNRSQACFELRLADPVTNIGDPDIGPYTYSFRKLARLAAQRRDPADDYIIAIASVPLQDNYFSEGLPDQNAIVITTHDADLLMDIAQRSIDKYVAVEIVANILALEFQRGGFDEKRLWHFAPVGCIFDFTANKRDMIDKVREARIHPICMGRLLEANLPESMLNASQVILREIRKIPLKSSAYDALGNPILGFLLGGVVASSVVDSLKETFPQVGVYATLILLLGVVAFVFLMHVRYNYRRWRRDRAVAFPASKKELPWYPSKENVESSDLYKHIAR